jgi:hypothetical protein
MFIPKGQKRKAKLLLDELEKRPHELTWNSEGIVFVNQIGIPGSNMYKLFPLLFSKGKTEDIIGVDDFYKKIKEMGLFHFADQNPSKSSDTQKGKGIKKDILATDAWWYIGP